MRSQKSTKRTFAEHVYDVLRRIPKGSVVTYQDVAVALGKPYAARAVGNALNANPHLVEVPCHRVVRSTGDVGGYARGSEQKIALLTKEGVRIVDGVVNIAEFRWANLSISSRG